MMHYAITYYDTIILLLMSHIGLTAASLAIGVVASIALTFLIRRSSYIEMPLMMLLEAIYTIPSLALFAILLPYTGLGAPTAVTALALYSLFFLVKNFVEGTRCVDPDIIEAAHAMGQTRMQVFLKIELPLAMPAMIAGVRAASVSTIGIACIAYAVGARGAGTLIFEGMRQMSYVKIALGSLVAILISTVVNFALILAERYFARRADPGRIA